MGPINLRPAGRNDYDMIDDMIKQSLKHERHHAGRPHLKGFVDLKEAIERHNNYIHHGAMMIDLNKETVGLVGLLYEEGQSDAWVVGPFINEPYHSTTFLQIILEELLQLTYRTFSELYINVPTSNFALKRAIERTSWNISEHRNQETTYYTSLKNTLTL
ncbi:hypothetical protein ABID56_000919 [Alkalibacillus flavidus]|uniref:N-acetyltransferase domain-containing protein n=1 Tax=Alkalibacillus flavidus TaxID=546021 RepID=A0ABV2KTC6_9BACI